MTFTPTADTLAVLPSAPPVVPALTAAAHAADRVAAAHVFADYRSRKAANTLRRQDASLAAFAAFLADAAHIPDAPAAPALATDPTAWAGISWGLVAAFSRWCLARGYAIGSVNLHLTTLRVYARLAMQAGSLDPAAYTQLAAVRGYAHAEGSRIDESRRQAGAPSRIGAKKAQAVSVTPALAYALTHRPATPQGLRDSFLMYLLLDHGLRAGEVARLRRGDLDLAAGELRFYRPKVDKTQTHRLTPPALQAARLYLAAHPLADDAPLVAPSNKAGELLPGGVSAHGVSMRVRALGEELGAPGLSAHDLRHAWATRAARNGTPLDRLQDAGGWSSPAMPLRYVEAAQVANEGVRV